MLCFVLVDPLFVRGPVRAFTCFRGWWVKAVAIRFVSIIPYTTGTCPGLCSWKRLLKYLPDVLLLPPRRMTVVGLHTPLPPFVFPEFKFPGRYLLYTWLRFKYLVQSKQSDPGCSIVKAIMPLCLPHVDSTCNQKLERVLNDCHTYT